MTCTFHYKQYVLYCRLMTNELLSGFNMKQKEAKWDFSTHKCTVIKGKKMLCERFII